MEHLGLFCAYPLTAEHPSVPGCICPHSLRPHCGFLQLPCRWTAAPHPALEPAKEIKKEISGGGSERVKFLLVHLLKFKQKQRLWLGDVSDSRHGNKLGQLSNTKKQPFKQ